MGSRMRCLLIINQCNPEYASVPLVGYHFFDSVGLLAEVTLVTHERNRPALEKVRSGRDIVYIPESPVSKTYYTIVSKITHKSGVNWPLAHALTYPIYEEFNRKVYWRFSDLVRKGMYDVVHALTPIIPRYPVKIVDACGNTPFILGPVNGGLPFLKPFPEIERKEFGRFTFLRGFSRIIPGYARTYRRSDKVLAGSSHTLGMIRRMFGLDTDKLVLFFENGIPREFFVPRAPSRPRDGTFRIIFVGRLVALKGLDMLIDALGRLREDILGRVHLTVVGDGPERASIEMQVREKGLAGRVSFAGWVPQRETVRYYSSSDLFCFPSVREFGGAVVMEAMACGLPCIVANFGGIGEYVTDKTGFRIDPISREHLVMGMKEKIELMVQDRELHEKMSRACVERAREFEWGAKAQLLMGIYEDAIEKKNRGRTF